MADSPFLAPTVVLAFRGKSLVMAEPSFKEVLSKLLPKLDQVQTLLGGATGVSIDQVFDILASPLAYDLFTVVLGLCSKQPPNLFEDLTLSEGVEAFEKLKELKLDKVLASFKKLTGMTAPAPAVAGAAPKL